MANKPKSVEKQVARTAQSKETFLSALTKSLGNITQAAKMTGVGRRTIYEWLNDDAAFAEECRDISEIAIDFVESKLFKLVENQNPAAIIFYLKTRAKHRGYVERTELTGANGGAIATREIVIEPASKVVELNASKDIA